MARKCKCKICGKVLTTDIAYKVIKNNKNLYYCDSIEYEIFEQEKKSKELIYEDICDILGYKTKNTLLFKEIANLNEVYSHKDISDYLKDCKSLIMELIEENGIDREFNKIRYIFGVLSRGIQDFINEKNRKIEISKIVYKKENEIDEENNLELTNSYRYKKQETTDFSSLF